MMLKPVNRYAPLLLAIPLLTPIHAVSKPDQRVVILRERAAIELHNQHNGALTLELLKIRGYRIDVRIDGKKRTLKRGESFSSVGGECSVTFQKVSPETPIARFLTDCS